jgi:hypothetical protein
MFATCWALLLSSVLIGVDANPVKKFSLNRYVPIVDQITIGTELQPVAQMVFRTLSTM